MNDADKIDAVLPEQLKMGDFVVVRETAKDLIREMADVILARSGKVGLREMAGKWKEALEIETLFYSDDEIYQHLQNAGCTKGYQAVRGWIHDDDVIAERSSFGMRTRWVSVSLMFDKPSLCAALRLMPSSCRSSLQPPCRW